MPLASLPSLASAPHEAPVCLLPHPLLATPRLLDQEAAHTQASTTDPSQSHRPPDLVVHDGAQAHDADVCVRLLANDAGVAHGLPAVAWGQPGRGVREAVDRAQHPMPSAPSPPPLRSPLEYKGTTATHEPNLRLVEVRGPPWSLGSGSGMLGIGVGGENREARTFF